MSTARLPNCGLTASQTICEQHLDTGTPDSRSHSTRIVDLHEYPEFISKAWHRPIMANDFDLIVLITNPDAVQLAISRDQLEQAGIQCQLQNESFGGLYGEGSARLQRFAEPQLVVFRKDAKRSAEILGTPVPTEVAIPQRIRRPGVMGWIR
jgi:hypothetical protein